MFARILVPVDLSEPDLTKAALDQAVRLASLGKSALRLLHVMPLVPNSYLEYVPADFERVERERLAAEINDLARGLAVDATLVSTAIRQGGVYSEVLSEAEAWHADLIVTGSHHPTLATYLIGSHATNIVRYAHCSVLVVRTEG